jgi:hypothetical protein
MTAYQERVIAQTRRWVEGNSRHNFIDDECCPDFSCCMPECFDHDRGSRLETLNRLLRRYNEQPKFDA